MVVVANVEMSIQVAVAPAAPPTAVQPTPVVAVARRVAPSPVITVGVSVRRNAAGHVEVVSSVVFVVAVVVGEGHPGAPARIPARNNHGGRVRP